MRVSCASFFLSLSLFSAHVSAANARCEYCDLRGFENVAKSLGVGEHVVFSLSQGTAHGFTVERDVLDRQGSVSHQLFAYPRTLTEAESAEFQAVMVIKAETGGSMKYERTVPIGRIPIQPPLDFSQMTAHEYARRMGDWHRVAQGVVQWSRTGDGTFGGAAQYWQTAGSMVGMAGTQVEVTVEFAGGGKVTFLVDFGTQTMGQQLGPIRDKDNNVIPTPNDSPSVLNGSLIFTGSGQDAMNRHLSDMGWDPQLRLPQPPASCRYSGPMIYECSWSSGLTTWSCRRLSGC